MTRGPNPGASTPGTRGPDRSQQIVQALGEAIRQHQAGHFGKAKALYGDIRRQDPGNAAALHFLGLIAFDEGRPDEAVALMTEAIERNATVPQFHGNLGEIYRKIGRFDDAIAACQRAIAMHPIYPEAWNTLGVALSARGEFDEAETALRKAIEYKPDFAAAHAALADVLRARGDQEKAIRAYRRALRKDAKLLGAYLALGSTLDAAERSDEAVETYDKALEIAPGDPRIWSNRGVSLGRLGRGAEALECFRKAVDLCPDLAETQVNLGKALLDHMADVDTARACFARAAEIKPAFAEAHFGLGRCALARADWDAAVAAYRKALELQPRFLRARSNLGTALLGMGDYAGAEAAFAELLAVRRGPVAASVEDLLAARLGRTLRTTRFALLDRAEQIEHLVAAGLLDDGYGALAACCRAVREELPDAGAPERPVALSEDQSARLGGILDRVIYFRAAPRCAPQALNPGLDFAALDAAFAEASAPLVPADDLLTPEALAAVQGFCRESTIFFESDPAGFVAATLDEGLHGALLFQIAEELRVRLPRALGGHPLAGLHIRRYAAAGGGAADDADSVGAAVAVQLWVTPDAANMEPDGGGLIVDHAPAEGEEEKQDLRPAAAAAYRCNRAVIYSAARPHGPDRFRFAEGFENRRVAITFLFGHGEAGAPPATPG